MIGRPPKAMREPIGSIKCPICGETVPFYRGHRGTAYCNHAGHGFKLSKRQVDDFLKKNKVEETEKKTDKKSSNELLKEYVQKTEKEEKKESLSEELGISLFGMRF